MPAPVTPLQPQAALEEAVRRALVAPDPQGLGLREEECKRMYDGQPPANMGTLFVAVWGDGSRRSESRTSLNEVGWAVKVTITRSVDQARDRLVQIRDEVEALANRIRALLHKDSWDHRITNAANLLCVMDPAYYPDTVPDTKPVGFREPLMLLGVDPCQLVGPDWFSAEPSETRFGITQTIRCGEARFLQHTYYVPTK